jgi:hypothetical protein
MFKIATACGPSNPGFIGRGHWKPPEHRRQMLDFPHGTVSLPGLPGLSFEGVRRPFKLVSRTHSAECFTVAMSI